MSFNKNINSGPCKDCEERHEKCHMQCEKYIAYQDNNKKINDARRAYSRNFDLISETRKREIWKKKRYGSR